jgi:hypothetical protein
MLKYLKFILLTALVPGVLLAQQTPQVIPLWPNGAPGFESRKNEPELAKDYWVRISTTRR